MKLASAAAFATVALFVGNASATEEERKLPGHTAPFPEEMDLPTCNYIDCLSALLDSFGEEPFGDAKLDRYSDSAATKLRIAKKVMEDGGNAVVSVNRLLQATKWFNVLAKRASNIENERAEFFGNDAGELASMCAAGLLEEMIDILTDAEYFEDEEFLGGTPTQKLEMANSLIENGQYKKSVRRSNMGIRDILNEAGERDLPICLEDH